MANDFLDKDGRDKLFGDIAKSMNDDVQSYLKETGKDSVEFSIGMLDFKIHRKEIKDD